MNNLFKKFCIYCTIFVLFSAGVSKIINPNTTVQSLIIVGITENISLLFSVILSFIEISIAFCLAYFNKNKLYISTTIILFTIFNIYLLLLYSLDTPIGCGCGLFPVFKDAKTQIAYSFGRNSFLLICLIYIRFDYKTTKT